MITDVHAHMAPQNYLKRFRTAVESTSGPAAPVLRQVDQIVAFPTPLSDTPDHIEMRLRAMDDAGVERQVLSLAGLFPHFSDEQTSRTLARAANESMMEAIRHHPDRFSLFLSLPLPHVEASVDEVLFWAGDPKVVGAQFGTSVLGQTAADPAFGPVFASLETSGLAAFYHPLGDGIGSCRVADAGLTVSVGTSFEDTMLAIELALEQIPILYPKLPIIVPHLGGMVSLLLDRLDNQGTTKRYELAEPISATLRRLYYDTVTHGSNPALVAAVKAFGAERIVPGSDYPVLQVHEPYSNTFSWIGDSDVSADEKAVILHRNAPQLLNTVTSQTPGGRHAH